MTRRISLWSGPRNVSTALMYSWRQRPDTEVIDEPLYGHYLRHTGRVHPAHDEVMAAMDCDGERVVREVFRAPSTAPVRFFKNMAHHLVGLDRSFLSGMDHVLLIRDPREVLTSLVKQIPRPRVTDTGLLQQVDLLEELDPLSRSLVVVDSTELLRDPAGVLRQLCEALDLPYTEAMLSWPRGPKPEDGMWAPHWYHRVHETTGFAPYVPKTEPLPERLEPLWEACQPLYARLRACALRAGGSRR